MLSKLPKLVKTYQSDIILAITVVLISIMAFNLGKISAFQQKKTPIKIIEPVDSGQFTEKSVVNSKSENPQLKTVNYKLETNSVVASKNSTSKVYHFPWCPSASKIADKNKLTFATETAAISAGYTLAGNCQR